MTIRKGYDVPTSQEWLYVTDKTLLRTLKDYPPRMLPSYVFGNSVRHGYGLGTGFPADFGLKDRRGRRIPVGFKGVGLKMRVWERDAGETGADTPARQQGPPSESVQIVVT